MTGIAFIRLTVIGSTTVIELLQVPIIIDLHLSRIADLQLLFFESSTLPCLLLLDWILLLLINCS
jgi:hypothetical protein